MQQMKERLEKDLMEVWHLLCDGKGDCLLDWTNLLGPHVLLHWFSLLKWKKLWITPTYDWGLMWSHVMMIAGSTTSSTCESVGKWKCYWASLQVSLCVFVWYFWAMFHITEKCEVYCSHKCLQWFSGMEFQDKVLSICNCILKLQFDA
jgi:hypothetical protein